MTKVNNKKIYDENWGNWTQMKLYGPASKWLRFLIEEQLNNIRNNDIKTILDVGCGEGIDTYLLAKNFPKAEILGIDFSKSGIDLANFTFKSPNLKFIYDIKSSRLNRKYDLVTAFEVLEHVKDWQSLLGKMANSSKKYLLLSFPTGRMRDYEVNMGHVRNYQKNEIEVFLKEKGYSPIKVFYAGFPFYSPIYREICNLINSGNNSFTKNSKYGFKQKIISLVFYNLFRNFSTREKLGDQFCGLFKKGSYKASREY